MLIGVLRISWDDAFVEDNGCIGKTGAAPQENPGRCKKCGEKKNFPVGMGYCVTWLCWGITSDELSAPKLKKMLPQGLWGIALISPLYEELV